MKNKNVKRVFAMIIASVLMTIMTACSGNNSNRETIEDLETTAKESVTTTSTKDLAEVIQPEDTVKEITYTEEEDLFLIENVDHSNQNKVDMDSLKPNSGSYVLNKSVDIYYTDAILAGYTKENIRVSTITSNEEWTYVSFVKGSWLVKTNEFEQATIEVEKTTENSKSENIVPTEKPSYTITDMSKIMYAKQSVNLRSGPNTSYDKVGSLSTNQEVKITGQADTGWYRISYNGGIAFVSNKYLSDNKIEVNTSTSNSNNSTSNNNNGNTSNSNNNNENSNNNESNEQVAPTPEQTVPEPTPQPSVSADTVKANLDSALRGAGLITIGESVEQLYQSGAITEDDYNLIQSTAPTYGAGWFMGYASSSGGVSSIVNTYTDYGYKYYYIEYLGQDSDGQHKFKCFYDYD